MTRRRFTINQIKDVLQKYEDGTSISRLIEEYQISQATFYNWKSKYGRTTSNETYEIKKLKEENERLKRMFADISLENQKLKGLLSKYENS